MTEAAFNVPEMSGGHCKAAVEGELNKLEDAIEEAGYSVRA